MIAGQRGFFPRSILPRLTVARLNWLTLFFAGRVFRRTSYAPGMIGTTRKITAQYGGFPHIDSTAVDYGAGMAELDDLIFCCMSFPPDELSAGREGDYIWRDLWTGLSVRNRSVTGSLAFGSSQRLGRCCLWLAALPFRLLGSADVPLCHHLLPAVSRSASHEVEAPFLSPLCRHPVWPDGGSVFAELSMYELDMSVYAPLCRHLLSFDPAVPRTASGEGEMYSIPPCFRLILTFCYCFYEFLRELDIGSGRSPDRDEADPFHGQTRWAKLNDFAPDIRDAMELWALGSHAVLVKVISVCRLHVFFHQYVVDL